MIVKNILIGFGQNFTDVEARLIKNIENKAPGEFSIVQADYDHILIAFKDMAESNRKVIEEGIKKELAKIGGLTIKEIIDDELSFFKKIILFLKGF